MTRGSLDRTLDRITIRHAERPTPSAVPTGRRRHLWIVMGGVAGSLIAFWVMVQLGQAASEAQTTAPSSATAPPQAVAGASPEPDSEEQGCAATVPLAPPVPQGPAIDTPREIIDMLEQRKKDLDRREQVIRKDEGRLHVLKAELESLLTQSEAAEKRLEDARRKMQKQTAEHKLQQDQFVADRKALFAKQSQEQKNQGQAQLAKMYESMPAEEAAARLEQMPERKAIEMLRLVKGKTAGAILAQMKAERAAKLTEQLLAPAP